MDTGFLDLFPPEYFVSTIFRPELTESSFERDHVASTEARHSRRKKRRPNSRRLSPDE